MQSNGTPTAPSHYPLPQQPQQQQHRPETIVPAAVTPVIPVVPLTTPPNNPGSSGSSPSLSRHNNNMSSNYRGGKAQGGHHHQQQQQQHQQQQQQQQQQQHYPPPQAAQMFGYGIYPSNAYAFYGGPQGIPTQGYYVQPNMVGAGGSYPPQPGHIPGNPIGGLDSPKTPGSSIVGGSGSPSIIHGSPVPNRAQMSSKSHTPIKLSDPVTHQPIDLIRTSKPAHSPSPAAHSTLSASSGSSASASASSISSPKVVGSPKPVSAGTSFSPTSTTSPSKASGLDIQNQLKEQIRLKLQKEREEKEAAEKAEKDRLEKEHLEKEKIVKEAAEKAERERLDKEAKEKEEAEKVQKEAASAAFAATEKERLEAEQKAKHERERAATASSAAHAAATNAVDPATIHGSPISSAAAAAASAASAASAAASTATPLSAPIVDKDFEQQVAARVESVNGRIQNRISSQNGGVTFGSAVIDTSISNTSASHTGIPLSPVASAPVSSISNSSIIPESTIIPASVNNTAATLQLSKATRPKPEEVSTFTYPTGVHPPTTRSQSAFKYDIDFLLQFQAIVNFPPRENWEAIRNIMNLDPNASGSGGSGGRGDGNKSFSNKGFPRSGSLRNMSPAMGSMGQFGSGNIRGDRSVSNSGGGLPFGVNAGGAKGLNRMPSSNNLGASMGSKSGRQGSARRRGGGDRSGSSRDAHSHDGPGDSGTTPPPAQPAEKLVRSANAWVPKLRTAKPAEGADDGKLTPEEVQRKVNSLLNKMTLENFDRITKQIMDIAAQSKDEKDGRTLRQVIELTFAKAIDEPHWSKMYAQFCKQMTTNVDPEIEDENIKDNKGNAVKGGALFRKYLLTRCQEEFEHGWTDKLPTNPDGTPIDPEVMSDEYYQVVTAKRRGLGLIRFIGELYMLELLSEKIIYACITKLCVADDPSEEVIESLCQLLTTVGGQLERNTQLKQYFDSYFERIEFFTRRDGLPSRLRFMMMDVLDLRKNQWVNKNRDKGGPKTLSEIHDEAARKQQADEAARQSRNRSGRGLGGGSSGTRIGMDSRSSNNMMAGDLSKFGTIRSGGQTLGPSSLLNRDAGGSNSSRKSSSSAGLSLSKEGSRTPSQNSRVNIFEHLNDEEKHKSDGEEDTVPTSNATGVDVNVDNESEAVASPNASTEVTDTRSSQGEE